MLKKNDANVILYRSFCFDNSIAKKLILGGSVRAEKLDFDD
ncbi:hypothetical protein [Liquorilactobacillus uvarum]|nr:hypothetical protein [Liquorilactobacillus uvarum]